MAIRDRIIWREGLFIKPQHFQQQQRHTEHQLHQRIGASGKYFYGLKSLKINEEYLNFGRIELDEASGIMADGTVFSTPSDDLKPQPLDVKRSDGYGTDILLAIPMEGNNSVSELSDENQRNSKSRLLSRRVDIRDLHSVDGDVAAVETAGMNCMLIRGDADKRAYNTLTIARILEIQPDGKIVLDKNFLPCSLCVSVMTPLHSFVGEMISAVSERAANLEKRIATPGQKGVADVADFLLLQLLNRIYPQLQHFSTLQVLHPERLYEALVQFCGELMTFVGAPRLPGSVTAYSHEKPTACFSDLMNRLRQAMSAVLTQRAEPLSLSTPQFGIRVATISDSDLLKHAEFVLAVKANLPDKQVIRQFPQQIKIASSEKIRELVTLQLPGIPLIHMTSVPRQLPYHTGYSYFRLQKQEDWTSLITSNSLAFHLSGDFPDLDMQLWAIRSS